MASSPVFRARSKTLSKMGPRNSTLVPSDCPVRAWTCSTFAFVVGDFDIRVFASLVRQNLDSVMEFVATLQIVPIMFFQENDGL